MVADVMGKDAHATEQRRPVYDRRELFAQIRLQAMRVWRELCRDYKS